MRSYSKLLLVLLFALLVPACKQKVPPAGAYLSTAPDRFLIMNMETGTGTDWPTQLNPNLYDKRSEDFKLMTPAAGLTFNPTTALLNRYFGGPQGFRYAQISGNLVDPGDSTYPSFQLRLGLKSIGQYYDMSFFSGVKYYLKIPNNGDPVKMHNFNLNLRQTVPVPDGGECNNANKGCYNNFAVKLDYTSGWEIKSFVWGDFTREAWGTPVEPPSLTGANLKELVNLEWQIKRNNTAGTSVVDLSLDDIRFF